MQNKVDQNTIDIAHIIKTVKNEFKRFLEQIWNATNKKGNPDSFSTVYSAIETKLNAQIEKIDLNEIHRMFVNQHPWAKGMPIAKEFLEKYLVHKLLITSTLEVEVKNLSKLADFNSVIKEDEISFDALSWKNLNKDEKEKDLIQEYPYLNLSHYDNASNKEIYAKQSLLHKFRLDHGVYDSNLNCIDIFKVIFSIYSYHYEQYHNSIPVDLNHIDNITDNQRKQLKTLWINVSDDEKNPLWIIVHRKNPEQKNWTAYIPSKKVFDCYHALEVLKIKGFDNLITETVNYDTNLAHGLTLSEKSIWHIVLISKVFDWCEPPLAESGKDRKEVSLESYRSNVPLFILLLEACKKTNHNTLRNSFLSIYPFGEKKPVDLSFDESTLWRQNNYLFNKREQGSYDYAQMTELYKLLDSSKILESFYSQIFSIDHQQLTLNKCPKNALAQALLIIYLTDINQLHLNDLPEKLDEITYALFTHDLSLIQVTYDDSLVSENKYPLQCAARNRFLKNYLDNHPLDLDERKDIWQVTGKHIFEFIQNNYDYFIELTTNKSFVKESSWYRNFYEKKEDLDQRFWSLMQVNQMGSQGLEVLFNYLTTRPLAPYFKALFSLNDNAAGSSADYIDYLVQKIVESYANEKSAQPLLDSLSLILPNKLDQKTQAALFNLFKALGQLSQKYPQALQTVNLYNLDIENIEFIKNLTTANLQFMIKVPEWDTEAYYDANQQDNNHQGNNKAAYRALQNSILNNRKKINDAVLNESLLIFSQNKDTASTNKQTIKQQIWNNDISYPLQAHVAIQHQSQQEVQQQQEQQQEQRHEQQQEQKQAKQANQKYSGNEANLVDRNNIDKKYESYWQKLSEDRKKLSGYEQGHGLSSLFSLWVGSQQDAIGLIQKIELKAVEKIMANPAQFRLGISYENLPVGFYLANAKNGSLILCFSSEKEQQNANSNDSVFTVRMPSLVPAQENFGDFGPLKSFTEDESAQLTLAKYLFAQTHDNQRIENEKDALPKISEADRFVRLQVLNIDDCSQSLPKDYDHCLTTLKQWANKNVNNVVLTRLLFESENKLTEDNLKAFGQLFNQYGADETKKNGNYHWLQLANQIFIHFGEQNFIIWKKRFLDQSHSWQEFLAKSELEAVTSSINLLTKYSKQYTDIWWQLLDHHGASTGAMHYSSLWPSFDKIIDYVEKNNLKINPEALLNYLKNTPNFHLQLFLERLDYVLKNSEQIGQKNVIQQHLLDNIDKIDWTESGYAYAVKHDSYNYWDESLQLTHFNGKENSDKNYKAKATNVNQDLSELEALRFASQKLQLDFSDFKQFKQNLNQISRIEVNKAALIRRIYLASISIGIDNSRSNFDFQKLAQLSEQDLLSFSDALDLEKVLTPNTLKMHFNDISIFYQTLANRMPKGNRLDCINRCGRGLQYYKNDKEHFEQFVELYFKQGKTIREQHVIDKPWLLLEKDFLTNNAHNDNQFVANGNNQKEIEFLYQQLHSIDLEKTNYLPNSQAILTAISTIAKSPNIDKARESRRQIISQWIKQGCTIKIQDSDFRIINESEQKDIVNQLENKLQIIFKASNRTLVQNLVSKLTVVTSSDNAALNDFIQILIKIDNSPYYNNLGQVLGTLLRYTNNGQYYSLKQLNSWLTALIKDNKVPSYFPIELLNAVLSFDSEKQELHCISADLANLANVASPLLETVRDIAQLSLVTQHKAKLIQSLFKTNDPEFIRQVTGLLKNITLLDSEWSEAIVDLISEKNYQNIDVIKKLTEHSSEENLAGLWQRNQIKLSQLVGNHPNDEQLNQLLSKNPHTRIIIGQSIVNWDKDKLLLTSVTDKLDKIETKKLRELTNYYQAAPIPSITALNNYLNTHPTFLTQDFINDFERNIQGQNKRQYNFSNEDANLQRVINNIKWKSHAQNTLTNAEKDELVNALHYLNHFSLSHGLEEKSEKELNAIIDQALSKKNIYGSAEIMACVREIVLRKTGIWANSTQMIALLAATTYQNKNIIYQMRTGEGKSIFTAIYSAYAAINGKIIDDLSAKESLSYRDYLQYVPVFDALHIQHSYIRPNDEAGKYHTQLSNGRGAVHYGTASSFALFFAKNIWENTLKIDLNANNRLAFVDEIDYSIHDDNTQFNFSYNPKGQLIYNPDAWVYELTYRFYLEKNKFADQKFIISSQNLQELCQRIVAQASHAPKQSEFIKNYLEPALSGNAQDSKKRDQILVKLLTAAHSAAKLEAQKHFCIMPEVKEVNGEQISVRTAKVIINNQIQAGSAYSDLVQQFLHIRLNEEAVKRDDIPNFFIDSDSQIALSLNASFDLQHMYAQIIGCTGTAGSKEELEKYQAYAIDGVIKVPTHQESKTQFLPTLFCDNQETQITAIVKAATEQYQDQPILITCKDDIEVKKFKDLLNNQLNNRKVIFDTNDSGRPEIEVTREAGEKNCITFSSRMGRGTDIQPKSEQGLAVIRTYPTAPRIAKQERGRQGRNGNMGSCQEILNYQAIEETYQNNANAEQLKAIYTAQEKHLNLKISKHQQRKSSKWDWIKKDNNQEKYLKTRSLMQWQQQNKDTEDKYLRQKQKMLATYSHAVMVKLLKSEESIKEKLKQQWSECLQSLDKAWNLRLETKNTQVKQTNEQAYQKFAQEAQTLWQELAQSFELKVVDDKTITENSTTSQKNSIQPINPSFMTFHHQWLANANAHHKKLSSNQKSVIYNSDLHRLHTIWKELFEKNNGVFELLTKVTTTSAYYYLDHQTLIKALTTVNHVKNADKIAQALIDFVTVCQVASDISADNIKTNGQLLTLTVKIAQQFYSNSSTNDQSLQSFVKKFIKTIHGLKTIDFAVLDKIFTNNFNLTCLLVDQDNLKNLAKIIELILPQSNQPYLDDLITHFDKYGQWYQSFPQVLPLVFKLGLIDKAYLPDPKDYVKHKEIVTPWYQFLIARMPVDQRNCDELFNKLIDLDKGLQQRLFNVSAHIPLSYINKYLSKYNGEANLKTVEQASNVFNEFLTKYEISQLETATLWSELFLTKTPAQNAEFFKLVNSYNISLEAIKILSKNFDYGSLKSKQLKEIFELYNLIDKLSSEEVKALLILQLSKIMHSKQSIERLKQFIKEIKRAQNCSVDLTERLLTVWFNQTTHSLSAIELQKIIKITKVINSVTCFKGLQQPFNTWLAGHDWSDLSQWQNFIKLAQAKQHFLNPELTKQLFILWQQNKQNLVNLVLEDLPVITFLVAKFGLNNLKDHYINHLNINDLNYHHDVITLMNRPEYSNLDRNVVQSLMKDCLKKRINCLELKEILLNIEQALSLKQQGNYQDYFSHFDNYSMERRKLMQLTVDQTLHDNHFEQQCHQHYKNLIANTVTVSLNQGVTHATAHQQLAVDFKKLKQVSQEIAAIAQSFTTNSAINDFNKDKRWLDHYFEQQQQRYKGFWWTNRKAQSNQLFKGINKIKADDENYFIDVLNHINKTLEDIAENDNHNKNKKGYSRLHDIASHMFLTVAQHFLDSDASLQIKAKVNASLEKALKTHLTALQDGLANNSEMKTAINKVINVSTSVALASEGSSTDASANTSLNAADLQLLCARMNDTNIPKHLWYLRDSIYHFSGLIKQENVKPSLR